MRLVQHENIEDRALSKLKASAQASTLKGAPAQGDNHNQPASATELQDLHVPSTLIHERVYVPGQATIQPTRSDAANSTNQE